jgi:hypothetical protein
MNKESIELFQKHNKAVNMEGFSDYKPNVWQKFKDWLDDFNPFNRYKSVKTVEEYTSMPRRDRMVWGIFYMHPHISGPYSLFGHSKDRKALDEFIKKEFPVQNWIRETSFTLTIKFSVKYDKLRYFLNPRQKWLIKQIPNEWNDKTNLIPLVNFSMVKHFVEVEDARCITDWANSGDSANKFYTELKDCHDYIKNRRPQLEKDLDASYPDEDNRTGNYEIDYAETNRLELLINKEDTKYLTWIVVNRDFFWS